MIDRSYLEDLLPKLALKYHILRLKGRCWLSGKSIPLQLQMVGPRLTTWFESAPEGVWKPNKSGIDLVGLSFMEEAEEAIRLAIEDSSQPY